MLKVDRGCCKCFKGMLQAFVQNVSSVPDICCKRFDLDVAYILHIFYNNMFQMFHLFQSSVAASVSCCKLQVFYRDVAYVFTHMLQVCFLYVSSISDVCCIQVFHVAYVSCCSESQGHGGVMVARHGHRGMGHGEPVVGERGTRRAGG